MSAADYSRIQVAGLRPCRNCRGTKLWLENENMAGRVPQWVVTCVRCGKRGRHELTKKRAVKERNGGK